jgi:uncharacterized protein (TIGR02118 family)
MLAFEKDLPFSPIPGLKFGVSGTFRRVAGQEPRFPRGALLAYDDDAVAARLTEAARAGGLEIESIDASVEILLEPRAPGQPLFALIASFDYAPEAGDAEAAERHYLDYHVTQSRQLPGLRGYITGTIIPSASTAEPRRRMGIEIFDSRDMLATSFRSPIGEEVRRDGQYVCGNVRVRHLDGQVIL